MFLHVIRCTEEIFQIGTEVGIGKIAVAVAEPGEIKAQNGNPSVGQRPGNTGRRRDILGTGEAMGK